MFSREHFIWNGGVVSPGDKVTIRTPHGSELTGRVVMSFTTHVVLNVGGAHGTPKVADSANILSVKRRRV